MINAAGLETSTTHSILTISSTSKFMHESKRKSPQGSTVKNLARRRFSLGMKTPAKPLAGDEEQICRAQQEISTPEPPGLSTEPEQPFQPAILHPLRRLPQRTGKKRKSGPYRENRQLDAVSELVGPHLLAGAAQANKHNLRA